MFDTPEFVSAGGLMSYGTDLTDLFRRAATYVHTILRGARPADLPVAQATKFELVVNRRSARALGPPSPRRCYCGRTRSSSEGRGWPPPGPSAIIRALVKEEGPMNTFRLYTGSDGQSHIEPVDLARAAAWTKGIATTQIAFRESPVGNFIDWHPAPRRQFVIILSGQLEIGLGDGSKHLFGAGDARLVEDTTGKGHTTRVHGNVPCLTATVPLAEQ